MKLSTKYQMLCGGCPLSTFPKGHVDRGQAIRLYILAYAPIPHKPTLSAKSSLR